MRFCNNSTPTVISMVLLAFAAYTVFFNGELLLGMILLAISNQEKSLPEKTDG